jgi:MFS transporter, DHA1 family, multidrug resistance protein
MTTSLASLPRSVRRRGLLVLLATTFLMWAGFFMIVPILSVHFVDDLGWAAASIGLVLALRQFVQQTLTVVSGALAPELRNKPCISGVISVERHTTPEVQQWNWYCRL